MQDERISDVGIGLGLEYSIESGAARIVAFRRTSNLRVCVGGMNLARAGEDVSSRVPCDKRYLMIPLCTDKCASAQLAGVGLHGLSYSDLRLAIDIEPHRSNAGVPPGSGGYRITDTQHRARGRDAEIDSWR